MADLESCGPTVARPSQVENPKPVRVVAGTRMDQLFLGSWANAKYEDLAFVARILEG